MGGIEASRALLPRPSLQARFCLNGPLPGPTRVDDALRPWLFPQGPLGQNQGCWCGERGIGYDG